MAEFKYVAYTKAGVKKEGKIEAEDNEKVANTLHEQGLTVVEISEFAGFELKTLLEKNIGGIPIKYKVLFFRQMSYMLSAGLPLVNGLEVLHKQAKNKTLKSALKTIVENVRGGAQLNVAMSKFADVFDKVSVNLIKAGEESGNLDVVFERLATDYEKRQEFEGKIQGAMIYPAIILLMVVGVVGALLIFMVPSVKELFAEFDAKLPPATSFLIGLSDTLLSFWGVFILIFLVALVFFYRYYRGTKDGREATDKLMLKIPIFGELSRKSLLAQFARTFSMLLSSGVEILDTINLTSESLNNVIFSNALKDASIAVEKGGSLAKVIERADVFPPIVSEMISVGEKTGKLDEIVSKMGDYFESEADQMASNLTKTMEPVIMIVVGLLVAFIALSVYTPIFSLGNVIK